jgi:hypothetical protein
MLRKYYNYNVGDRHFRAQAALLAASKEQILSDDYKD